MNVLKPLELYIFTYLTKVIQYVYQLSCFQYHHNYIHSRSIEAKSILVAINLNIEVLSCDLDLAKKMTTLILKSKGRKSFITESIHQV